MTDSRLNDPKAFITAWQEAWLNDWLKSLAPNQFNYKFPESLMSINNLGKAAHEVNANNGWEVFFKDSWPENSGTPQQREKVHYLLTHMALVHSEVSEATEAVRKFDKSNFEEELADVAIRVASIAYGLGIDLEQAMVKKIAKNKKRGLHHGGKAV
jgi:NTP pyrophosphatase (non-canonical NTP hydrolase)